MFFDIYMILITSFAVFGVYCFIDLIYTLLYLRNMPRSITILSYSIDSYTKHKIKLMQNTVAVNDIVFLADDKENIYDNTQKMSRDEMIKYIEDSLFTNG